MLRDLKLALITFVSFIILTFSHIVYAVDIPSLKVGYVFTTHHTPLMVAAKKAEAFKSMGVYLKHIVEKDRYELIADEKPIAILQLIVAKSGAETAALFARNQLDIAMASVTAMMSAIDKGTPIKILSPIQTEGMALVVSKDSQISNWASFMHYIKNADKPVKIGYHSPTSAPKIVFEGSLKQSGIKVTENPNDQSAQVLLVDLKETTNLIPALTSKQVDAVVGPSPFPEVSVARGVGKIVVELRDLPPKGYWHDFPCCVTVASDEAISKYPKILEKFVLLISKTNVWCNKNKVEAATITAEWIGLPPETAKSSSLVYLPKFTKNWMKNANEYLLMLNKMNKFTGKLKNKTIDETKDVLFFTQFIDKAK